MKLKKVTAMLLALTAAASAMTMPVSAIQFFGGDIDGDDDVDAADAALILQYAAYVGAGGTESIFEYVEPAETPDPDETDDTEGQIVIEGMTGKTLTEVIDAGYDVNGYLRYSDVMIVYASNGTYTDDSVTSFVDSLNGRTVKEMVDEYDISIGYFKFGSECKFYSTIGTVQISYDLAHGAEAIELHSDETFFDLEEAEEVQSDVLENIQFSSMTFQIELDDESREKLLSIEDIKTEDIKRLADQLVVSKVYYTVK